MEYMRSINFMFLGGLIMAIAVERTGLHRRVALAVLRLCGSTLFGMMAGFMAATYGRLTGKAGVCLSTLGPGATNLMTGVADANLDRAPLVAITGQVGTDRMHIESHQYLDLVAMFDPVTRWNKQIVRPDATPEIIRKAFKVAQSEPPGAS